MSQCESGVFGHSPIAVTWVWTRRFSAHPLECVLVSLMFSFQQNQESGPFGQSTQEVRQLRMSFRVDSFFF